jgi:hypothetical protein
MTMKTHFPTLLMILLGVQLNAQPVLNFVDVGTVPGDAFAYHDCPWQTPGTPGMAQTWDLSGLTTDSVIQISFVDPATTPDAASFPLATIAADNDSGYAYSAFGATGGQFLGISLTGLATIVYTDPMQMVVYPATYLTTWTDAYAANFSIGGFPIARTGTVTAEVDGYGTLTMPYGTLSDVLRVSYVEDSNDDNGFGATSIHQVYTYFIVAGTHYPVVDIYSITVTPAFGTPTTTEGTHWLVAGPEAVQSAAVTPGLLRVYPIPATDRLNVEFLGTGTGGLTMLELVDASGRVVVHRTLGSSSPAKRSVQIVLHGLDAGMYLLRATVGTEVMVRNVVVE